MSFEVQDIERKGLTILKVLDSLKEPAGARIIAKHLKDYGVELNERTVRYHLKLMDERGLTQLIGKLDGRVITEKGCDEIRSALVKDKVGFAISRIETLAFRTNFDYEKRNGIIPVNVSLFPEGKFEEAVQVMRPVFEWGFCVSPLVAVAASGQKLGEINVPFGKIGLATVCSIVINGTLLKAGIPMDSRFGGILQIHNRKPMRFVEIINYNGSSLDPSEMFIKAKMTNVREAVASGNGKILANFREIPALCRPIAERVLEGLKNAGLGGIVTIGDTSKTVCEVAVEPNKLGLILLGGLNPVAAAQEAGIEADNHSMSTVMEYQNLVDFREVLK